MIDLQPDQSALDDRPVAGVVEPAAAVCQPCGVPEVGPGPLTSGDRRLGMIPSRRWSPRPLLRPWCRSAFAAPVAMQQAIALDLDEVAARGMTPTWREPAGRRSGRLGQAMAMMFPAAIDPAGACPDTVSPT